MVAYLDHDRPWVGFLDQYVWPAARVPTVHLFNGGPPHLPAIAPPVTRRHRMRAVLFHRVRAVAGRGRFGARNRSNHEEAHVIRRRDGGAGAGLLALLTLVLATARSGNRTRAPGFRDDGSGVASRRSLLHSV